MSKVITVGATQEKFEGFPHSVPSSNLRMQFREYSRQAL